MSLLQVANMETMPAIATLPRTGVTTRPGNGAAGRTAHRLPGVVPMRYPPNAPSSQVPALAAATDVTTPHRRPARSSVAMGRNMAAGSATLTATLPT